eukprot:840583_1
MPSGSHGQSLQSQSSSSARSQQDSNIRQAGYDPGSVRAADAATSRLKSKEIKVSAKNTAAKMFVNAEKSCNDGKDVFGCPFCSTNFLSARSLEDHTKSAHGKTIRVKGPSQSSSKAPSVPSSKSSSRTQSPRSAKSHSSKSAADAYDRMKAKSGMKSKKVRKDRMLKMMDESPKEDITSPTLLEQKLPEPEHILDHEDDICDALDMSSLEISSGDPMEDIPIEFVIENALHHLTSVDPSVYLPTVKLIRTVLRNGRLLRRCNVIVLLPYLRYHANGQPGPEVNAWTTSWIE